MSVLQSAHSGSNLKPQAVRLPGLPKPARGSKQAAFVGFPHSWFQALVCGRNSPGSLRPLVHTGVRRGLGAVNNFQLRILWIVDWPVLQGVSPRARLVFVVNNCVDNNPLSKREVVIRCWQFIERAETDGSGQQIEAESLQDNPR